MLKNGDTQLQTGVFVIVVGGGGGGGDVGGGGGGGDEGGGDGGGGGIFAVLVSFVCFLFSVDGTGLGFIDLFGMFFLMKIIFVVVCLKTNERCVACPYLCDRAINPKAKSCW